MRSRNYSFFSRKIFNTPKIANEIYNDSAIFGRNKCNKNSKSCIKTSPHKGPQFQTMGLGQNFLIYPNYALTRWTDWRAFVRRAP